ncbi:FtsK/SpoIIIE domain-containing protein [Pseudonocardia broussonetiae]|uniref:FtsK domain-containing protein n=1 Tax=Pseudonocardia broussonetiae TaxID=2736640 RepID=A0A6M6JIG4_9PSEU|nr:FtsK/SpoIIIE domain-containing protein [Pseudonocardia broussonetiae]QJY46945.1 hypothetical protein HOP40_14895 [Pseudonocardia broussonetiae]
MTLLDWHHRRTDRVANYEFAASMRWAFRQACIGAGVCLAVDSPIAGTSFRTPEVTNVELGTPLRMTVRMLEGTVPAALARAGHLIAPHLGGVALRVADRGFGWAVVTVLTSDPLAGSLELPPSPRAGVLLGRDEGGENLEVDPVELPHLIVQGQTRSGKSTWLYALIVQLLRHLNVVVAGVDPSGITLRPFTGTAHARWQASGLADPHALEAVLVALVADMDARLAAMPLDRDILPISAEHPLVVTILDEYPALLRALDAADPKQGKRVRALVARLLAESHKVGHRMVIAAQRAEASIVGAAERAQCGGRLSFRVDSADSVKLLHSDAELLAGGHTSARPGIALCSWPGRPLTRIRGPYLGGYGAYAAAVTAATRGAA